MCLAPGGPLMVCFQPVPIPAVLIFLGRPLVYDAPHGRGIEQDEKGPIY